MGTLMTWALPHDVPRGARCQTVSVPRWTARASAAPPGPGARAAVPAGSGGSGCHRAPAPVMTWPRFPAMIAAVPAGPNDAEVRAVPCSGRGGDRVQWLPSADRAASRLAADPLPAVSSAVRSCPVRVSLTTVICCPASAEGTAGPAGCQVPSA